MRRYLWVLTFCGISLLAHAQARPLPGPDVQQIYQRLLPQIEKIPIFDHHAHPGYSDDPDIDAMAAHWEVMHFEYAIPTPNSSPPPRLFSRTPMTISRPRTPNGWSRRKQSSKRKGATPIFPTFSTS